MATVHGIEDLDDQDAGPLIAVVSLFSARNTEYILSGLWSVTVVSPDGRILHCCLSSICYLDVKKELRDVWFDPSQG